MLSKVLSTNTEALKISTQDRLDFIEAVKIGSKDELLNVYESLRESPLKQLIFSMLRLVEKTKVNAVTNPNELEERYGALKNRVIDLLYSESPHR
ncbi:hypothetical protein DID80_01845 [Candidatus Marinamargulisbacteria bacterium SCGC AAA071-K20]|nr:hypothetical protein DID80_01845 [Candidatus Marinamargulisbacteria bacterium SCGC AAA071-K20]